MNNYLNKAKNGVKKVGKTAGAIALGTLELVAIALAANEEHNNQPQTGYSDAIKAVTSSDMWSSDCSRVIKAIPADAKPDFYNAIIAIVESDMWSSEKARAILSICEKE